MASPTTSSFLPDWMRSSARSASQPAPSRRPGHRRTFSNPEAELPDDTDVLAAADDPSQQASSSAASPPPSQQASSSSSSAAASPPSPASSSSSSAVAPSPAEAADASQAWLLFVLDSLKRSTLLLQDLDESSGCSAADFRGERTIREPTMRFSCTVYAPAVFRRLQAAFGVTRELYARSWELSQNRFGQGAGRSGSLFLKSADHRFFLKTISPKEAKHLLRILPDYVAHMQRYAGDTLLLRLFGLYWFDTPGSLLGTYAITFNNLFFSPADPLGKSIVKFDLKGRKPKPGKEARYVNNPKYSYVFKDTDILEGIVLEPAERAGILATVKLDTELLCQCNLMDYSLLVGVRPLKIRERLDARVDEQHPVWSLIQRNDVAQLRSYLDECPPPDVIHPRGGETPLHVAVWQGRTDIVLLFLNAGVAPDCRNSLGLTPLHLAAARGSKTLCRHLLDFGADVNATSLKGNTPLHRARANGRLQLCRWLVANYGADASRCNLKGEPAFTDASRRDHDDAGDADSGSKSSAAQRLVHYDHQLPRPRLSADGKSLITVGIIDFLCYFGYRKRAEFGLKRAYGWKADTISVNPPDSYSSRFLAFTERLFLCPDDPRTDQCLLRTGTLASHYLEQLASARPSDASQASSSFFHGIWTRAAAAQQPDADSPQPDTQRQSSAGFIEGFLQRWRSSGPAEAPVLPPPDID